MATGLIKACWVAESLKNGYGTNGYLHSRIRINGGSRRKTGRERCRNRAKADGHAADAQMMQQGWPKNVVGNEPDY